MNYEPVLIDDVEAALVAAQTAVTELRDENPTGAMWRMIDGEWTQGDVG